MKYHNKNALLTLAYLFLFAPIGWCQESPIMISDYEVLASGPTGFTVRIETRISGSSGVAIGSYGFRSANPMSIENVPPGFVIDGSDHGFARPEDRDISSGFLENGPSDEDPRHGVFATTISTRNWRPGRYDFVITAHNRPQPGPYHGDARSFSIEVRGGGEVRIPPVTAKPNLESQNVVIYREAGVYAPFPELFQVGDNVLLSKFTRKATRNHIDDRNLGSVTMISRDAGISWQQSEHPTPVLPYARTSRGEWVRVSHEGWQRVDASEREKLEEMGRDVRDVREGQIAYLSPYYRVSRSRNEGKTWEEERIRAPEYVQGLFGFFETHSAVVTSAGVRLRALYGKVNGSDQYEVFFLRSTDDGRNWEFIRLQPGGPEGIGFGESALAETEDGRLLIVMRTDPPGDLWQSFSDDGGEIWTPPEKTEMWGYPPHLLRLPDDRIVCTYGYRRSSMGVRASISEDQGRSWKVDSEFILRGDGRHQSSDQGYPTSVLLKDGSLFTNYYITLEDNVTHIAGTRWRLPSDAPKSVAGAGDAAFITFEEEEMLRREAAGRSRRILFNNDGGDARVPSSPVDVEQLLAARTAPLVGSQVDTIIYDTTAGTFGKFAHRTTVAEVFEVREGRYRHNVTPDLLEHGTDPLQVMLDFAREHQFEFFWTMRVNDTHDAGNSLLLSDFKKNNPELLFGSSTDRPRRGAWSGVDYAQEAVREMAYRVIEEVAVNYDVDGIHLDFFRHPIFFKDAARGQPLGEKHLDIFTAWMTRVRTRLREIGAERGKPILLAIRVPDSVEFCRQVGIDLERWLADGLVDIFVPGGYFRLNDWQYSVELGRKHGVRVYPCLSESRVGGGHNRDPERRTLEAYRARAASVWNSGADGVYLFNMFDPKHPMLHEIGSRETLADKGKTYFASVRGDSGSANPNRFVGGSENFFRVPILTPDSPQGLRHGVPVELTMNLGENIAEAYGEGLRPKVILRLRVPDLSEAIALETRLNGRKLNEPRFKSPHVDYLVDAGWLRPGNNRVTVTARSETGHSVALRPAVSSISDGVAFTEIDVEPAGRDALRIRMAASPQGEGTIGSYSIRMPDRGGKGPIPPGFIKAANGYSYPTTWSHPGFRLNGPYDEAPGEDAFAITLLMQGGVPGEYTLQLIVHNRPNPGPYVRDQRLISFVINEKGEVALLPVPCTLEDVQLRVDYGD